MTEAKPILGRHLPTDPHDAYAQLLAAGPVHWSGFYRRWVVLGYDAAREVLLDDSFLTDDTYRQLLPRLSGDSRSLSALEHFFNCTLFYIDPPAHESLRRFLAKLLTHRPLAELRRFTEEHAARLIADARREGGFDLVRDYARPIAAGTIARILGVPAEEIDDITRHAGTVLQIFDVLLPLRAYEESNRAMGALLERFAQLVRDRRHAPREDGISLMIRLADENDIDDDHIAGYCAFLFIAGEETTASYISGGAAALFEAPDVMAQLSAKPAEMPRAADELLRLVAPVQTIGRRATQDRVIAGAAIAAGSSVSVFIGSANRDPQRYPDGGCPILQRNGLPHLSFGLGSHACLGAALARMEGAVAFTKLLNLPRPHYDKSAAEWAPRRMIRGLSKCPVRL